MALPQTLATYTAGTDALIGDGTRQVYRALSSYATADAINVLHDTSVEMVTANIWNVTNLEASLTWQLVTENFIQQGINKGGNPQGVDASAAPYFHRFSL